MKNPKHKKVTKNHAFKRHTLEQLTEAWSCLTKGLDLVHQGMHIVDQAILKELLAVRKSDRKEKETRKSL